MREPAAHHCTARPRGGKATLLLMAALGGALLGCGEVTRRTPDDTLVVISDGIFRDLDPRFAMTNHDMKFSRIVAPGLTTSDTPSTEPTLLLAESITPLEPRVWEAVLRPGLTFSDGTPLTAADVVYSYESVLDPELGSLYRTSFEERFRRIEAVDERTVRFHLVQPLGTFLSDLDYGIVSKAAAEAGGGIFPGGKVIGAGAYRIASYDAEDVVLEANEHYAGPAPGVRRVRVRTVRDGSARNLMLVGGSADFTQNSVRVDLVDYVARRARVEVLTAPSTILTFLLMHNEDPLLSDVRVRRAIALAIDREAIVDAKLGGRATLASGLLAPMHWAYNGEVERYQRDLGEAARLLDEAGYPDPDGPGGLPRMSLSYRTSADPFRLGVARLLAAQLGDVGIEVDVRSFEFGTFFADIKSGNYQLASMQTAAITEPDFYFTYYHSSRIPTESDPHTHNRWRYRNERVDELTARGRRTVDRDERIRIYGEVQEILARDLPIIPLWHEDNVAVVNVDVDGYELLPNARLSGLTRVTKDR